MGDAEAAASIQRVLKLLEDDDGGLIDRVEKFMGENVDRWMEEEGKLPEARTHSGAEVAEYPLALSELHERFCALVERTLESALADHEDLSAVDFAKLVRQQPSSTRNLVLNHVEAFLDLDVFVSMMEDYRARGTLR